MINITRRAVDFYRKKGLVPLVTASYYELSSSVLPEKWSYYIYNRIRYKTQQVRFNAPAHPEKILHINPKNIDRYNLSGYPISKQKGLGQIHGGEWDREENCTSMKQHPTYKGLKQRFEENKAWEETFYVEYAKERIEQRGEKMGYESVEEFINIRCEWVDNLYEDIRDNGYRSNREGGHTVPEEGTKSERYSHSLEPLIAIGRDGDPIYIDGSHRVSIATILDIDKIPVQVIARHKQWQHNRDELARASSLDDIRDPLRDHVDHPDIGDVMRDMNV